MIKRILLLTCCLALKVVAGSSEVKMLPFEDYVLRFDFDDVKVYQPRNMEEKRYYFERGTLKD